MTERENFFEIIRFGNPERIPHTIPDYGIHYRGCNNEGFDGRGDDLPPGSEWMDVWSIRWRNEQKDIMGYPIKHPLDHPDKLSNYAWPDHNDPRVSALIHAMAADYPGGNRLLSCSHRSVLWERAHKLVGMENLMIYLYTEPEFVRRVLHRIMDFQIGIANLYLSHGVELAFLGDDLGTQSSLLLSPKIIDEFLLPEYRRIFDLYKQNGVLINFHSCGHIEPLLHMLMELGADIINPVQATANNLRNMREVTQGRMTLCGGISSHLLMEGSIDEIIRTTKQTMYMLGAEGGYICTSDQHMPFEKEKIDAFIHTVEEYGRFPLSPEY